LLVAKNLANIDLLLLREQGHALATGQRRLAPKRGPILDMAAARKLSTRAALLERNREGLLEFFGSDAYLDNV
jgi:hypothetical protein